MIIFKEVSPLQFSIEEYIVIEYLINGVLFLCIIMNKVISTHTN